ncbi:coat protein [Tanacetum coccineum]
MLSSGFSGQGIAAVFVVAYHLESPGTNFRNYVFHSIETLEMIQDKPFNEFHDMVNSVCGHYEMIRPSGDVTREAALYTYIAASLFRLFTKPASNYVRSWFSIINGFWRFYGDTFNVRVPVPNEDAVQLFKYWLDLEIRAKVTFGMGLIVSIVMKLIETLNCSMGLIKAKEVEKQLECLVRVLGFMDGNDVNYSRGMWRYDRLFDEMFKSNLQLKSCPKLVYILAEAFRSEEPEKYLMRIISGNALLLVSGFLKYLRVIILEVHLALHSDPTLQGTRLKSMCDKLPMFNIHVECRDSRKKWFVNLNTIT